MASKKRRSEWIDWRSSKSKALVLSNLIDGTIPIDEKSMSVEVAWESRYKNATAFLDEHVQFDQFKTRLKDHQKQVSMKNSNKKRKVTISAASGLTPRKKKWTWRSSKSRALIMNDLIFKKNSIHENIISAETLWEERYKNAKAFVEEKIPFEQFKARLKDHRSQVSKQRS